ncbi:MAG: peptidoglycan DD-metalloendopeptidase family protein [Candidatus Scalindua sp.]
MKAILPIRGTDVHGSGYYGAPRGKRTHRGIDYACMPGTKIYPIIDGVVSKHGWVYSDPKKSDYRYVQVTDKHGFDYRYFYVNALEDLEQEVDTDTTIGEVQDLTKIYPGIINHCRLEIRKDGKYYDPENFIKYTVTSDC